MYINAICSSFNAHNHSSILSAVLSLRWISFKEFLEELQQNTVQMSMKHIF